MRWIVVIISIVAIVGALYAAKMMLAQRAERTRQMIEEREKVEREIPVIVGEVTVGDIDRVLKYTGTVEADEEVEVVPKISGRLISIEVKEGDRVSKGDTLAVIDPEIVGQRFEPFAVTSPIAGRVSRLYVDRGSFIMQGQPIMQVINDRFVKVKVGVLEKDYHLVKPGTPVRLEFDALSGKPIYGKVTNLSPVVDPRSGTATAEVRLDNANGILRPGMFAKVELVVETRKNAVLMPAAATLTEILPGRGVRSETSVFVVEGNVARERRVVLGLSSRDWYEVMEGLKPGERVVTTGQNLLRDGSKVRLESSD